MRGCPPRRRSAGAQLAPVLLELAVLLQPVHDAIQRRRIDAELRADLTDSDPGARFDHREQLLAAAVLAPAPAAPAARGRCRRACRRRGPGRAARRTRGAARRCGGVSALLGRDAESLGDLPERAMLVQAPA